jgi:hypothetical protein
MFLMLHLVVPSRAMGQKGSVNDYAVPIDLLGPMEREGSGTKIYLRGNYGEISVTESMEEIIKVLSMLAEEKDRKNG